MAFKASGTLLHPDRHAAAILLGLLDGLLRGHGTRVAAHHRLLLERGLVGLLLGLLAEELLLAIGIGRLRNSRLSRLLEV